MKKARLNEDFYYNYGKDYIPSGTILPVWPCPDGQDDITWEEVMFELPHGVYVHAGYPESEGWEYIND